MIYKHIQGAAELDRALKQLSSKLEARLLRQALRDGGVVLQKGAQGHVSVRKGNLRKTIRVTTRVSKGVVVVQVKAGNPKKGVFYAHLVEGGTKPHTIRPHRGKRLKIGPAFFLKVEHPGSRARPFMTPAFNEHTDAAIAAVAASLRRRLHEIAR